MYEDQTIEQLEALRAAKKAEALELIKEKDGAKPSTADIAAAQALQKERDDILVAINEAKAAADKDAADLADLESALDEPDPEDEEPEAPADDPDAPEVPAEPEAEVVEIQPEAEVETPPEVETPAVSIAAASRTTRIARTTKRPAAPAESAKPRLSIVASANVPDINQGTVLEGAKGIAQALQNRLDGFTAPNGDGKREDLQKFGIAKITIPYDERLTVREGGRTAQQVLEFASDVRRLSEENTLAAGTKALVAAGWCAPSITLYDLCEGETLDGIISVPEMNVERGGIMATSGPQFADFYGSTGPGFVQTEAQAIAGQAKTCVTVSCPAFTETRLDAIGLCIKTPILTESAYPELTERFVRGSLVAFEHQINGVVIAKMEALSNANRTPTNGLGSTVSDSLEALELLADEKRELYRLGLDEALEVIIPFWVRAAYKSDLRRRTGQFAPVTDAQMDSYFAASNMNVQWAYDWQPLGQTALEYGATYRVLMYKAGTFVKGVTDVINLSAVYDAASLAVNVYTGLFMERGLFVRRMCWDADRITLPICNAGRTGAADLTCEEA